MTNNEVLEKAIQKAIDGGWISPHRSEHVEIIYDDMFEFTVDSKPTKQYEIHELIYSHDFAKSFFGYDLTFVDEMRTSNGDNVVLKRPAWEAHLQRMVLEENPIAYLEDYL